MEINLFVYGINIRISALDREYFIVLKDLGEDFSHFQSASDTSAPGVSIEIKKYVPLSASQKGVFFFKNAAATVHGWGSKRVIDYGNEARIHSTRLSGKSDLNFSIFCSRIEDARELTYLTILSVAGEELDRRGFHRVHALGIERGGFAGIISLPSGYGKTSMAVLLSSDERVRIFSDETPLIFKGDLYAHPVRMALHAEVAEALGLPKSDRVFKRRLYPAKILYSIPSERVAQKSKISFSIIGGVSTATVPSIYRCSKLRVFFYLLESMVVGAGIAQIAEHMIRPDSFLSLVRIAFSRLFSAFRVTLQSQCYAFDLSKDAKKNATVLAEFLNTRGTANSR